MRARSAVVVVSLVAAGLAASAPSASAVFHFMKVREVDAGTLLGPNADFVELQMYQPFQNQLTDHVLHLYDASGARTDCTIPSNVTATADNDRILFATEDAEATFGVTADFTFPPMLDGDGGAVCFEGIDCVAWGTFSGETTHPAGTPFPGGIPSDQSIDRKGDDALDPMADTNDSANDFEAQTPDPTADSAVPGSSAMACQPGTSGGPGGGGQGAEIRGLKAKKKGNKAIIRGRIDPPAPGGKVKLTLLSKGSGQKKKAKRKDALNAGSRFKKALKVPATATRCKVTVRYKGDIVGKKKFAC